MCHPPAARPRLVDSVAAFATALVAALGAVATVAGAPLAEPSPSIVAAAAVTSSSAAPR